MEKETLKNAEEWFKIQEIPTLMCETSETICIITSHGFQIEISEEEITYRADLWTDYLRENEKHKTMKITISQRNVYHKYAEVEIEIPNGIECNDVHEYLTENEHLYQDKIYDKISKAEYEFGFGLYNGMGEKDSESEWRFDVKEKGKLPYGGHL